MVINGEYILTDDERKNRKMNALFACDEAQKNLRRLIAEAKIASEKFRKVSKLLGALQVETDDPLRSEADVLTLSEMDFGDFVNVAAVKALANSIALTRRAIADAEEIKLNLG